MSWRTTPKHAASRYYSDVQSKRIPSVSLDHEHIDGRNVCSVVSVNRRPNCQVLHTSMKAWVPLLSSFVQIFTCQFAFPCNRLISRAILQYDTDKYSIGTEWWFLYVDCRWMLRDMLPSLWYISILVGKFLECDMPHAMYIWRCLWGDDTERRRDLQGKGTSLLSSL